MKSEKSKFTSLFIYPPSADPTVPPISHSRLRPWIKALWNSEFLDENLAFVYYVVSSFFASPSNNYSDSLYTKSIKEDLLKSLAIFKSNLFLDIKHYVAAYSILDRIFRLFSKIYYPSQIGYADIKLMYSPSQSEEIKNAISDRGKNPFIDFFSSKIDDYGFRDILAISVIYSSQIIAALTLAKLYKERYPDSFILLGGPALFNINRDLRDKFEFIDHIASLDGEYFFKNCSDLIKKMVKNRVYGGISRSKVDLANCNGFYEMKGPLPDYDTITLNRYLLPFPVVSLDITRGCYYRKCVFCAYGFNTAPYRVMPIKDVIRLIRNLKEKFNVNYFVFSVDVVDTRYLELLSESIIESGIKINYYIDARIEKKFNDNVFVDNLAKSGCRVVSFGMESACKNTLLKMGKGIEPDYFKDVFKNLHNHDIHINVNVIHGFPGESADEIQKTLEFLLKNERLITTVGVSRFTLLRGSIMEKNYQNYGIDYISPVGDLNIWYKYKYEYPEGYPDYNLFLKRILKVFPLYGRLTGSTSDYLIYASKYSPQDIKELLRKAVELKLN